MFGPAVCHCLLVFLFSLASVAASPHRHAVIKAKVLPDGAVSSAIAKRASHRSAIHAKTGLAKMLAEIQALRRQLDLQRGSNSWDEEMEVMEKQLEDLEKMIDALAAQEARQHSENVLSHSDLQAEIDRLRESVLRIQVGRHEGGGSSGSDAASPQGHSDVKSRERIAEPEFDNNFGRQPEPVTNTAEPNGQGMHNGDSVGKVVTRRSRSTSSGASSGNTGEPKAAAEHVSEAEGRGSEDRVSRASEVDVDMAMPYGDLEPFGREDTAQELTEDSIRESNSMVDQLEKAEVAEEKRAVFRALTRLRGAAITSYDGIARSQTGNIDDYARNYQWRKAHPVHHLADDEADVKKWAFPDEEADF